MKSASVSLPGDRGVAVTPHAVVGLHIHFHKVVGGLLIKTEIGLSLEAAQALVNCMAMHGVVPSQVMRVSMEIPSYENLKGNVWQPVGATEGVDPSTVPVDLSTPPDSPTKSPQEHDHG